MKKAVALLLTLLLTLAMGAVVTAEPSDEGLLLYYSFDDVSGDTVKGAGSSAVDATATNVTFADGKVGKAATFSGDGSVIKSPGFASGVTGSISVSVWVKMTDVPTTDAVPYGILCTTGWEAGSLHSHVNNGKLAFAINGLVDENPSSRQSNYEIEVNWRGMEDLVDQWVHVAFTYDDETKVRNLYVNSTLVDTSVVKTMPASVLKGEFQLGAWVADAKRHLKGAIDELRIYNRALSATEVKDLALDATPVPEPTPTPEPTPKPTKAPTQPPTAKPSSAATTAAATATPQATENAEEGGGLGTLGTVLIIVGAIVVVGGAALIIFRKKD